MVGVSVAVRAELWGKNIMATLLRSPRLSNITGLNRASNFRAWQRNICRPSNIEQFSEPSHGSGKVELLTGALITPIIAIFHVDLSTNIGRGSQTGVTIQNLILRRSAYQADCGDERLVLATLTQMWQLANRCVDDAKLAR